MVLMLMLMLMLCSVLHVKLHCFDADV